MFKVVQKFLCFSKKRQRAQSTTAKVKPATIYPCEICDLRFTTQTLYMYHIKTHNNSTKPPLHLGNDKLNTEATENKTSGSRIKGSAGLRNSIELNLSKRQESDVNGSFRSTHLNLSRRSSSGIQIYFKSNTPHSRWTKMVFEEAKLDEMVENLKKKIPRQRREAELKFLTSNRKGKSHITYGINEEWIEKYENFLNGKSRDLPGPIDNQPLKDKLKLRASQHSYAVNELMWKFLLKLYGGGPEVIYKEKSGSLVMNDTDRFSDNYTNDTFARSIKSEVLESMRGSMVDLERTMKFDTGNPFRPMRMPNPGFYCYMNSCLQALLGIPDFVNYVSEGKYKQIMKSSDPKFWPAIAEAVSAYTSGETYFTPDSIRMLTRSQFNPSEQHDAHEFLTFIMSGLQDEVNMKQPKSEMTHKDGSSAWDYYRRYNISLVDDLFAGQLASSIECSNCHNVSTTYDPFLDLSLPIISEKTLTLDDCLANFQNEDEVIDSYGCEKCKRNGKAVKRLRIDRYPKLLMVQFKRFQTYPKKEKIQDHVEFPVGKWEIKASPESQRESQNYFLKAVICHIGPIDSGHYVCFSKRGNEWYLCDDEHFSRIIPQDICNGEAYVLIYGREE